MEEKPEITNREEQASKYISRALQQNACFMRDDIENASFYDMQCETKEARQEEKSR